jgi:hypothetical protein
VTAAESGMTPRPLYLQRGCPAWCTWPHEVRDLRADRAHAGAQHEVPLSLEDAVEVVASGDDWGHQPDCLRAYLWQHVEAAEPSIGLGRGDATAAYMTLAEATALAELLTGLVNAASARGATS